jgi:hypothetical protein
VFIREVVRWRKRGLWVSFGVGRRISMGGFGVVVAGGDGGVEVDVDIDIAIDIVFFSF